MQVSILELVLIRTGIGISIVLASILESVVILVKKVQVLALIYSRYSINK